MSCILCCCVCVSQNSHLVSVNVGVELQRALGAEPVPVVFVKDAAAFLLGVASANERTAAFTLGTGLGSAWWDGHSVVEHVEVAMAARPDGAPGVVEDVVSARGLHALQAIDETEQGPPQANKETVGQTPKASGESDSRPLVRLAQAFAAAVAEPVRAFGATRIVLGGGIAASGEGELRAALAAALPDVAVAFALETREAALRGAARALRLRRERDAASKRVRPCELDLRNVGAWRDSVLPLLPLAHAPSATPADAYRLIPQPIAVAGQFGCGFGELAAAVPAGARLVAIDGVSGAFFAHAARELARALEARGRRCVVRSVAAARRADCEQLLAPFLGGDDPIFGTRCTATLRATLDSAALARLVDSQEASDVTTIVTGPGSVFCERDGATAFVVYLAVPRIEVQFRSRAHTFTCIGQAAPAARKPQYKRLYFADWPLTRDAFVDTLLPRLDLYVDAQRPLTPTFCSGEQFRGALCSAARAMIRPRGFFEAGAWGGQHLKQAIPSLPNSSVNYAWSFELIAPENGVLLGDSLHTLIECEFEHLMMLDGGKAMLGVEAAKRFHDQFPIRLDYLDTVDGGNLSIQVHPSQQFMETEFGQKYMTQVRFFLKNSFRFILIICFYF